MYKRLYKCLEINEILHPLQYGFRKNHSTSHTLISMTEAIKKTIDMSQMHNQSRTRRSNNMDGWKYLQGQDQIWNEM